MNSVSLPDDVSKQWEILLLLLSSEEKKIDRTGDSEIDTMTYFCGNEGIRKILLQWLRQMQATYAKKVSESDTALKCDEVSLLWRQRGNDRFRANCVEDSYKCYCKSVVYAHHEGPMYPLALANRSAALLRMKQYKECLSDISLALDSGYPNEQQHKLLLRRADCYLELGQQEQAKEALEAATAHASALKLTSVNSAEFDRHVKVVERKLAAAAAAPTADQDDELPGCYMGENPGFVAASNAIEIRRSEAGGRYVVAREPARRGDVLFSEAPYAWVALPGEPPVCEACCGNAGNAVPCGTCSRAQYCGRACRARAQAAFHRWECAGAQCGLYPAIGIAHLALRVLLISANEGLPCPPGPEPTTAADLFRSYSSVDDIKIYSVDTPAFYRMFNLVTNFDKMNNTDYIQYAITATLLTVYLEEFTAFFDYFKSRVPGGVGRAQRRLLAAALLLRAVGQLVCNGHAALSLAAVDDDDGGRTVTEREVRRATAIYPSAAMMNHSCDPNIINTFHKSRLIIRCLRELPSGGEVANCYGPHRAREPSAHRRAVLRAQYHFTCACAACADDERKDFALSFSAYACPSCRGPVRGGRAACPQCRAPFEPRKARDALDTADELDAQASALPLAESRCERAHAALRLRQRAWHRHHAGLREHADRLARMYAEIGEFSKSVELIKQNIQSLEYQFGSFSVEVAHELRKLSDVMLERIINAPQNPDYRDWCLEAHKIIKKAVQLMELNYGSWEPLVKRLKGQEELVGSLLAESRTPDTADCVHHNLHYNLKI